MRKVLWRLQASVATDVPVSAMLMNATMPMPMLTPPLDTTVAALRQSTSVVCIVLSQGLIPPTGWLHGHTDPQNGGHPHHFPIRLSRVPTIHQPHLLSATPTIPKASDVKVRFGSVIRLKVENRKPNIASVQFMLVMVHFQ